MIKNQTPTVLEKKCGNWLVGDSGPYVQDFDSKISRFYSHVDDVKLSEAEEFHDLQKVDEKIKKYINNQYNIGPKMKLSNLSQKQNLIRAITKAKNRYCVEFKLSAWYVKYIGTLNADGSFGKGCLFYSPTKGHNNNPYMQICYNGKYSSIPNTRDTHRLRGYIKDNDNDLIRNETPNIYYDESSPSPKNISQSNEGTPTAKKFPSTNSDAERTAKHQQYCTLGKTETRPFLNPSNKRHLRRTEKITPNLFLNPAKKKHTSFRRTEKITPNPFLDQANKDKVNGVFNKLLQKNPNLIHLTEEQAVKACEP